MMINGHYNLKMQKVSEYQVPLPKEGVIFDVSGTFTTTFFYPFTFIFLHVSPRRWLSTNLEILSSHQSVYTMSFSTLKHEIWTHILEYLAPSLPMPLSGLTQTEAVDEPKDVVKLLPLSGDIGVTERTDIRSRELAALMRTSLVGLPIPNSRGLTDRCPAIQSIGVPSPLQKHHLR